MEDSDLSFPAVGGGLATMVGDRPDSMNLGLSDQPDPIEYGPGGWDLPCKWLAIRQLRVPLSERPAPVAAARSRHQGLPAHSARISTRGPGAERIVIAIQKRPISLVLRLLSAA